jgi:asparagine synthase (glutamine-hydrolysing)
MGAIAGILGKVSDANRAALQRMSAAMAHRGAREQKWEGEGVLLAQRELEVMRKSHPMACHDRIAAIDGTILRGSICEAASRGRKSLASLRGMFAIASWDSAARTLMLARDAMGSRPLYVAHGPEANDEWSLVFASELRAILASGLVGRPQLNPDGVASFIWNGFVPGPQTMVRGIELMYPGEYRVFDEQGSRVASDHFWSIPRSTSTSSDESLFRTTLRETVRDNLLSDVPVAVFLSGGIDSSSIANLAQQQSDRPIDTWCLAMEDAALSEAEAAAEIARAIGSNHHTVTISEQSFIAGLDRALACLDQPTFDGLNQFQICRAVAEAGAKVALGGIAGDAIYGGDITLSRLPRLRNIARATGWTPEKLRVLVAGAIARLAQNSDGPIGAQTKWAKLPDVARANGDLIALYQLNYALFRPDFQRELLGKAARDARLFYGLSHHFRNFLAREIEGQSPISTAAILETRLFAGERLIRDADTVSSALGVELRSPLADPALIDALSRIPESQKYMPVGRKPLLRRYGLEGLDPALFERRKSGFVLPFDRWIRANLGKVMQDTLCDERSCRTCGLEPRAVKRLWDAFQMRAPGLYWTRIWAVYTLMRWCQINALTI